MKTPKIIDDKKTRRYQAGDVVVMEYSGKNKPCDKAMAILLTSFTVKDGYRHDGNFSTMYAIDTDKEEFLKSGPISSTTCTIAKATPKMKAWFFEQIVKQFQKPAETEIQETGKAMVLYEVDEEDNTKTSIVAMTETDWQKRKPEAIEKVLREYFDERYADCDDEYFCYEDEIRQAVEALTTGYDTEFNGDSLFWDSVEMI